MLDRRPTLRDVAQLAGVSHVTVSRVVRGDHVVAAPTVARVRAAVKQLGYHPDPALSALASYRSSSKGGHGSVLAFLESRKTSYSHMVFSGAKTEAERLGYSLEQHVLSDSPALQAKLWRLLYHRGIRGILVGAFARYAVVPEWDWSPFAAVSLGAILRQPMLHAVTTDYFVGVTLAMRHLQGLGARRIGFAVDVPHEGRTAHRWLGGYLAALEGRKPAIYSGDNSDSAAVRRWMVSARMDGLLTMHQSVWAARPSSEIPTVFLNTFDCPPGVPCIVYDRKNIGIEGIRLIHHQCLNHEFGLPGEVKVVTLQPSLRLPSHAHALRS